MNSYFNSSSSSGWWKYEKEILEQREKVKVPYFIHSWYTNKKNLGSLLEILKELEEFMEIDSRFKDWVVEHDGINKIAEMHLHGYQIENEERYYWRKKREHLLEFEMEDYSYLNCSHTGRAFFSGMEPREGHKTKLTETEVRDMMSENDFKKLERVEDK